MNHTLSRRLFVAIQHLLPQHLLSRLAGRLASSRTVMLKDLLIRRFIAAFAVDMTEALRPDPAAYEDFNAFFTRALAPGARPLDESPLALVSPSDGAISQLGSVAEGRIVQAKGHWYSSTELLDDQQRARQFNGGSFATIYLSPRDYHRVHMPMAGRLVAMRYVPGRLFSVNRTTAEGVPRLFARNERLVCHFETDHGPMAMVLVGAMIVAGIETVWSGPIAPAGHQPLAIDLEMPASARVLAKGAEMGRFQLGSTVILLLPQGVVRWDEGLGEGAGVRMGERIGSLG
jgi:phosphatidylserine decarboxylase